MAEIKNESTKNMPENAAKSNDYTSQTMHSVTRARAVAST
jgi:hypothetical protein